MSRVDPEQRLLSRVSRVKQIDRPSADPLGPELLSFFKQNVQKRQHKLGAIAECWAANVPESLLEHCCLESFHVGTLKVIVDSSAHLYQLKQLLLSGLQATLLSHCKAAGLRKITLKQGRWYDGDGMDRRLRF